jgi:hypothetical protein
MPVGFHTIFFSRDDTTYRLHFPYILGDVQPSMLLNEDGNKFTSDIREYVIKEYIFGSSTYDIFVREIGADILPGKIEAWFIKGDKVETIPFDLLENIKIRNEEATQNRIVVMVNGKQV